MIITGRDGVPGVKNLSRAPHDPWDMLGWDHGGRFSLDGNAHIEATDRAGPERLLRWCDPPPFPLDRLHLVGNRSDQTLYLLPKTDPTGQTAMRLSAVEALDRLRPSSPGGPTGGKKKRSPGNSSPKTSIRAPPSIPPSPSPPPPRFTR